MNRPSGKSLLFSVAALLSGVSIYLLLLFFLDRNQVEIEERNFDEILDNRSGVVEIFTLPEIPTVIVVDFPDLRWQGAALNRFAALVEKRGLPRDRIVSDARLNEYMRMVGARAETFYFGHNYDVRDIVRFYNIARSQDVELRREEVALKHLLERSGVLREKPDGVLQKGAGFEYMISIAGINQEYVGALGSSIDLRRATFLHELGHALFATDAEYAAYSRRFWEEVLTHEERELFEKFLYRLHYETKNIDLVVDEMQAYIMFTPSDRIINDRMLGLPEGRLDELRQLFRAGSPVIWDD